MKGRRAVVVVVAGALIGFLAPRAQATFPGTNGRIYYVQLDTNFCPDIMTVLPDGTGAGQLTTCPGQASDPAANAAGDKIAWATTSPGGSQSVIYVMNVDGTGQIAVTTGTNRDDDPAWSPDGTQIAFARGASGPDSQDIYKVSASGGTPTNLTNGGTGAINDEPDWSPDGTKIVYVTKSGPQYEVSTMGADGSNKTMLTTSLSGNQSFPSWSPDGTKIAFSSDHEGNREIYVMNANGTGVTRITNNAGSDVQPAWSPDGAQIVFARGCTTDGCSSGSAAESADLYLVSSTGGSETLLVSGAGADSDPTWAVACSTCPAPPPPADDPGPGSAFHQRTVSLTLKGSLVAKGAVKVDDGFPGCLARVKVKIQRKAGSFKTIKTVTTSATGAYKASIPNKRGSYRALAPAFVTSDEADECGKATSPVRKN